MCGRYTLSAPADVVAEHFGLESVPEVGARYNIAPTQESVLVRQVGTDDSRTASLGRWGLRTRSGAGRLLINARSETVPERAAFREAFAKRRCLVPATGFYEWRSIGKMKQPFYFYSLDSDLFAFAGLWQEAPDGALEYTLLTTEANSVVASVHKRMPVLLDPADYTPWLGNQPLDGERAAAAILSPWRASLMGKKPVSIRVNDPAFDDPRCIDPLPGPVDLFSY